LTGTDQSERAAVGRVVGTFGLRGETKVVATDPSDLRDGLLLTARWADETERSLTVASVRSNKNRLLVRFAGVDDATAAEALKGALLFANIADLAPLAPDTYRDADLIGMHVTDIRLGSLGDVRDVLHYPHADMLVVGERSMLVPMLAAYGMSIDRAAAAISVALPEGFEEI